MSKSTIYSNWASKSEIVAELMGRFADDAALSPDSGDLEADLLEALRRLLQIAVALQGVAQSVVGASVHDPVLATSFGRFVDTWRRHERVLVRRSAERGLLLPDLDEHIATDLVASTVYFRVLFAAPNAPTVDLPERLVGPILRAWGACR